MEHNENDLQRSLVAFAIENSLLKIGKPEYEAVVSRLEQHGCYLPDCFNQPEYLKRVLMDIFGNAYASILETIEREMGEFAQREAYSMFLNNLRN